MTGSTAMATLLRNALRILPEGKELPEDEWRAPHVAILWVIWAHAVGVAIFGLAMKAGPLLAIGEGALIAAIGLVAAYPKTRRKFRGAVAALALVTSSAAIVQFSGGYIEAHFHYFVIVAVIALYGDWVPFLLAIVYVALDHGVIGTLFPTLVYNHPDGIAHPWKWALVHAVLVLGESAALLMGWKVAEQARRRTSLVLNSAGDGIVGTDMDGRVTFANPAAASLTQHSVDALQGRRLSDLVRDGPRPAGAAVVRKDGSLLPVEWQSTPIRTNGSVVGAVVTLKDIRERLHAERELRESLEREKLLVDIVSHDVKNQIAVSLPRLELLAMRHPQLAEQIEEALEPVAKGVTIIDDALCLLRLEKGMSEQAPVPLVDLLEDVASDLFPTAAGKGIQLAGSLDTTSDAYVNPLLQRAIHNVAANAIKWSPPNAEVEIRVSETPRALRIAIVDHGPGIPAASRPLLFQRFERLESGNVSGHGLGLAIAKRIVESEQGRILVEDTPGGGATFILELPGTDPDPTRPL